MASSSDGTYLVGATSVGYLYTSNDTGIWWSRKTSAGSAYWNSVASSSDGSKLIAGQVTSNGYLYTSNDTGITWYRQFASNPGNWFSVASSADGRKLVAAQNGGTMYGTGKAFIFASLDSGVQWKAFSSISNYYGSYAGVVSSNDGMMLAAAVTSGTLIRSQDGGLTWSQELISTGSANWKSFACSGDGSRLAAGQDGGSIFTYPTQGWQFTMQDTQGDKNWRTLASSIDGTVWYVTQNGYYISASYDSAVTWTTVLTTYTAAWTGIACSSDGSKVVAAQRDGYLYTSVDYGSTWTAQASGGRGLWTTGEKREEHTVLTK